MALSFLLTENIHVVLGPGIYDNNWISQWFYQSDIVRTALLDSENFQKINAVCNDSVSLIICSSDTCLLLLILLKGRAQANVWRYTVLTDLEYKQGCQSGQEELCGVMRLAKPLGRWPEDQ